MMGCELERGYIEVVAVIPIQYGRSTIQFKDMSVVSPHIVDEVDVVTDVPCGIENVQHFMEPQVFKCITRVEEIHVIGRRGEGLVEDVEAILIVQELGSCEGGDAEAHIIVDPAILGEVEEHVVGVEAVVAAEFKDVEVWLVECAEVFKEVIGTPAVLIIGGDDAFIDRLFFSIGEIVVLGAVLVAVEVAPETTRLQL
jgi:hypothetical protein